MARATVHTTQRVALLVDSENLEIAVSKRFRGRRGVGQSAFPNWKVVIPRILGDRKVVRNIYYKKRGKKVSSKFYTFWERELGGEIKQPLKSVDPYIVIDAITLSEKVDTVILLAGDKDYLPLIWYLKSKGCKVEMASFAESAAAEIRSAADRFHLLTQRDTVVLERSRSRAVRS